MGESQGLPRHVAIVMDGNGRWAQQHGLPKYRGHEAGMDAMIEVVRRSSDLGIGHLTVYAFSTENWKRSEEEVSGIFRLLLIYVNRELEELHRNNVRVDVLGDWTPFSKSVRNALNKTIRKTQNNTGLCFHIALNYGSRMEITQAAIRLAQDYADGRLKKTLDGAIFSDEDLSARLYTAGIPDPDLLIRPGGEMRVSNFLLWQCAYSELVFSDVLWPDFTPDEYERCLNDYASRERRFGGREDAENTAKDIENMTRITETATKEGIS